MTREGLATLAGVDVSREAFERLTGFVAILQKWSEHINLIGPADTETIWTRHVADSAQLLAFAPAGWRIWADLGAGGGFPGLVLKALTLDVRPDAAFHLVESDGRKAAFLSLAATSCGLKVEVHPARVEMLAPLSADVVSARALAPLKKLCGLAARHLSPRGIGVFPKGRMAEAELAEAAQDWAARFERHPSRTDPAGTIIVASELRPHNA
jgi:16S rRNA (guanine527-N7)-methyltransferase